MLDTLLGRYRKKEQTYLKHFFLERYLETVAFHIGYTHQEFVYVDCFSGPWRSADEDLADTSIRIALDKLNYVRDALAGQGRHATIRAIFTEKDPTAFRALNSALQQHGHSIKTTALLGAFEDNIPAVLQHVGRTFTFFFIDPKGWTGFAMDNIRPVLRHQPGEVMVNFMYDFVNRFINYPDPANEQSLDRFFGTRGISPASGHQYDRELHPETWPRHPDGPFVLLFHDRDISLQRDFVERTLNALPNDITTLSMNHYVGILHAQVSSASEGIAFGFQYEEPYCAYFRNHPSSWKLLLGDPLVDKIKQSTSANMIVDGRIAGPINTSQLTESPVLIHLQAGTGTHSWKLELE